MSNARVRHNIDTHHAHGALKGSKDREFKRASSRRPGASKFPVVNEARKWLAEVMDMDYSPHALSGNGSIKKAKRTTKAAFRLVKREVNREVKQPARSVKRALKAKKQVKLIRHTDPKRWATVQRRANAVLKNRGASLAGAAAGALSGVAVPVPGAAEAGAVTGAKTVKRLARARRARFVAHHA
jgi:hypothetical protein